jgi:hypothetical protein
MSGSVLVSQIVEPRTVYIVDDRVWWTPRLDQLLQRVEALVSKRPTVPDGSVREWIARQLAGSLRDAADSWEEAALDLLLADAPGRPPP